MTKAEAVSRIEMIEGMTGSRALALVEALDALGLLHLHAQLEQVLSDRTFRQIKDDLQRRAPTELIRHDLDEPAKLKSEGVPVPNKAYG